MEEQKSKVISFQQIVENPYFEEKVKERIKKVYNKLLPPKDCKWKRTAFDNFSIENWTVKDLVYEYTAITQKKSNLSASQRAVVEFFVVPALNETVQYLMKKEENQEIIPTQV